MGSVDFDSNWTTLSHGNPSFVEELRVLPGGYYLKMGSRGNMKLTGTEMFTYYRGFAHRHKTESPALQSKEYKDSIEYVCGMMQDRMIRECSNFKLPFGMGSMCVEQVKSVSKKRYNINASKAAGRPVYDHRPETNGEMYCVVYHNRQCASRHMKMYYFRGKPTNKFFPYSGNRGVVKYAKELSQKPGVSLYSCRPLKC